MKTAVKKWLRYTAFVGAFAGAFVMCAFAKPTAPLAKEMLTWAVPPFAPAFITDQSNLTGYAADTQNWFVQRLTDYDHTVLHIPLSRLLAEMRNTADGIRCSTTLIPTPDRREFIVFAKTVLLHLPISIVIRQEDFDRYKPFMNDQGHILLWQLLSNVHFQGAVRLERAYGGLVDSHLARYRTSDQVMEVVDDTKLLKMLALKRIDWSLYFPSEAEYSRRQSAPDQAIMALPIAGNTNLLEATIGCANTPAGRTVIKRINAIIDANPTMPWTDFYAAWLNTKDREWFEQARQQFISASIF